jgi:ATP/maltotriose-dependent transcriptional regulator MalT
VPESLQTLASTLADYLCDTVLDREPLSTAYILDALASLDITLVGVGRQHTHQRLPRMVEKLWS